MDQQIPLALMPTSMVSLTIFHTSTVWVLTIWLKPPTPLTWIIIKTSNWPPCFHSPTSIVHSTQQTDILKGQIIYLSLDKIFPVTSLCI
jgi:hypothetical protein